MGKFNEKLETGNVDDSAFCTTNIFFLIKSSQDDSTADAGFLTANEQMKDIAKKREATSM